MKPQIKFVFAILSAMVLMVAFQNCGGSFDQIPVLGSISTTKNNGNGYQGANGIAIVASNGAACEGSYELANSLIWNGAMSWQQNRRDCKQLDPAETVPDSEIAVSDLNFRIVVRDGNVFSKWTEVPMQGFCAVVRADRTIERDQPIFALTDLDGAPRANVLYVVEGETDIRGRYELPIQINGNDITVTHADVQIQISGATRGGNATMSVQIKSPEGAIVERTNLPVRCFANPGKLNP